MEITCNKDRKSWFAILLFLAEFIRMFLKGIVFYPLPLVLAIGLVLRIEIIRKTSIALLFFYCVIAVFGFFSILALPGELLCDDLDPYLLGGAFVSIEIGLLLAAWLIRNPYKKYV